MLPAKISISNHKQTATSCNVEVNPLQVVRDGETSGRMTALEGPIKGVGHPTVFSMIDDPCRHRVRGDVDAVLGAGAKQTANEARCRKSFYAP